MGNDKRRFEGIWIPAEIWLNFSIEFRYRVLVSEIKSLDTGPKGCTANNAYFAKQFGVSETTASNWISHCVKKTWISREVFYKAGSKEVDYRSLRFKWFPSIEGAEMPEFGVDPSHLFDWEEAVKKPFKLSSPPFRIPKGALSSAKGALSIPWGASPLKLQGYNKGYNKVYNSSISIIDMIDAMGKYIVMLEGELEDLKNNPPGGVRDFEKLGVMGEPMEQPEIFEEYKPEMGKEAVAKLAARLKKADQKYILPICRVVDTFNREAEGIRSHNYATKGVYDKVLGCLKGGHTVEDVELVIRYKVNQLKDQPQWVQLPTFLRSNKFEANLEAAQQLANASQGARYENWYVRFAQWISQNPVLVDRLPTYNDFEAYLERRAIWAGAYLGFGQSKPREMLDKLKGAIDEISRRGGLQGDKPIMEEVFSYFKNNQKG